MGTLQASTLGGYLGTGSYARPVVVICGILSAGLFVATGYAPHLYLAIISYGLLGVTTALTYPIIYGSLAKHFSQRRCLAYGIANSGTSIGSLTFPFMISYLLELYTIRGTMVILGGCMLHACLCGMLLRNNAPLKGNTTDQIISNKSFKSVNKTKSERNYLSNVTDHVPKSNMDRVYVISHKNGNISIETSNDQKDISYQSSKKVKELTISENEHISRNSFKSNPNMSNTKLNVNLKTHRTVKETPHTSPPCPDEYASQITDKVLYYKELICNMEVLALTVCCQLCWFGSYGIFVLIPMIMTELGYGNITGSILMAVYSSVELFTRPILGWVSDKSQLTRSILFPTLQLILGFGTILISLLASLHTMVVLCVLVGVCGTSFLSFMGPLYADTVGPQNGSKTGSFVASTAGMFFVIINPVIGVIKERTNTYLMSLTFCGCIWHIVGKAFYQYEEENCELKCLNDWLLCGNM